MITDNNNERLNIYNIIFLLNESKKNDYGKTCHHRILTFLYVNIHELSDEKVA